jgi:8-amino-7-oxononanoate synthase
VGISPPLAAASLAALRLMQKEPERVGRLQQNAQRFLQLAREAGLDTGRSQGYAIIPIILGGSIKVTKLSNQLFERGINVQPIVYPAVEEKAARLRFFISSMHREAHLSAVIDALADLV